MTEREVLKLALEALEEIESYYGYDRSVGAMASSMYEASNLAKITSTRIREALANYNPTSDHCMMENAQGELERIRLVQTGVGIGKPEQEPVAWDNCRSEKQCRSWCGNSACGSHWNDTSPPAQPEQEPVAWRNAALRVGEDLCSVGPFGYYDMTAEQWLDWALSVVTVHTPPPQRTWVGLTDEEILHRVDTHVGGPSPSYPLDNSDWLNFARAIEAAHGIKE